jgi:hypothetical protein
MREHHRPIVVVVVLARVITQFFLLDKDFLPTQYGTFCLDPYILSFRALLELTALFVFRQARFQTFWSLNKKQFGILLVHGRCMMYHKTLHLLASGSKMNLLCATTTNLTIS